MWYHIKRLVICLMIIPGIVFGQTFVVPRLGHVNKKQCCASKRISSHPYISNDTFRTIADFWYDETQVPLDPALICDGDIIFVRVEYLCYFFQDVHPSINKRYLLLTNNSNYPIPCVSADNDFTSYLDDSKLIAWFGCNVQVSHPKLHALPLGFANAYVSEGSINTIETTAEACSPERDIFLYMNFKGCNNVQLREKVKRLFRQAEFCHYEARRRSFKNYLYDLSKSVFVLCPNDGFDCHRHWEALFMGAIPIMTHSLLDPLFQDLPVLIINDWSEITKEFLAQKYEEMTTREYAWEKLYADYWINKIMTIKNEERNKNN